MYGKDRTTILDRREMLRVKLKSLAAESKIIRHEERKSFGQLRNELWAHRILIVRSEARHTHIAYGLIRGHTLEQMEAKSMTKPDWDRVKAMVKRYGPSGKTVADGKLIDDKPKGIVSRIVAAVTN